MTTPVCTGSSGGAATTGHTPHPGQVSHTLHTTGHGSHSQHGPQSTHLSRTPRTARAPYASRTPYAPYPSFSSFVRARGPVLLRAARSLTANPSDAEDLLQTALTKTYVAWERIEDHRALDGYVRRALLNTRTSQWRKRKVDEFACDELPEQEAVQGPDPAEQQSLHDAMWRAVLKLPDRQRAMVVLRYYEDLSEAQTAEVLGVSVGTVKSAVSRALGKLREDPELAPVR
ncbi:SigE family RNA polymerase sigma factor [Streptomyces sp. NPDC051658]|uniref:SigE family RNA polymerase sigma factor n=1 Tax=unclassified Streptomyces TaxID=2593676 RepID=UPI002254453D|nr:SigE family RNA polymerase sigma factor [Streptomyces sp. NBC_01363]MCX4730805.1 SigE family RNA polymerase sigma factor [Streptomyces sp. NBC_01363]WSX29172.1 SigE family RNA polymerase sigma factor [Streptomyces sp. NBC_00984]